MLKFFALILIACLLAACTPSAQAIQTAIAQTQNAIPTVITPTFSPTPKTLISILQSSGFVERTELETGCDCSIFRNSTSVNGMTTIKIISDGTMIIFAPIRLDVIIPVIKELYGEDVATWITNNSTVTSKSQSVLNSHLNTGNAGEYQIEVDFTPSNNINQIIINK